jgi:hypothetical protein
MVNYTENTTDDKYTVINVFQLNYDARLISWCDLRKSIENADVATKCVEIDKWWQHAPLVSHYLHPNDKQSWPNPWEMLVDNQYCSITRGLGMIYTLLLSGIDDVDFCMAIDDNSEEVAIVVVDSAKYVLNYWPNSVLSNNLQDFKVVQKIDITDIKTKL